MNDLKMFDFIFYALGLTGAGILIGLGIGTFLSWAFPRRINSSENVFHTPLETAPIVYVPEEPVNFISNESDDELTVEEFIAQIADEIPTDDELIKSFEMKIRDKVRSEKKASAEETLFMKRN